MNNAGLIKKHDASAFRRRFQVVLALVSATFAVLVLRMAHLQILRGDEFAVRSGNNSVRLQRIPSMRGVILDRTGRILVDNEPSFDVLFLPKRPRDGLAVLERFGQIYRQNEMEATENVDPLKLRPFRPVPLDKKVDMRKIAIVETHAMDLPGVFVDVVPVRQYLEDAMFAPVLGYTGEISRQELESAANRGCTEGDMVGKDGLERHYDAYLRGKAGAAQIEVNAIGKQIRALGRIEPVAGASAVLTLDAGLQKAAWEALGGRPGAVVAMDPRNGAVLALTSTPSYDPNWFTRGISPAKWQDLCRDPRHPMENRAIAGLYPPGSTYKVVVAAAALEEGLITPEKSFYCNGAYNLGNRTYRCWLKGGHGHVSLHRAIVESCDVYFYNLGKLLGVDRLAKYAQGFGFGVPSGIDLPREQGGIIPTRAWKQQRLREPWQMGETISLSIGQGFNAVTPLQIANAYSALANGGTLYLPRLVERIEIADGRVLRKTEPKKIGQLPVQAAHLEVIRKALWGAVNEPGGTGYALKRRQADVCGKTGTAQVVGLPEDERERRRRPVSARFQDHALFVCFAPCDAPEIVVAVIVENAGHGGAVAAPVARKVIDAFFAGRGGAPAPPALVTARADAGTDKEAGRR